MDLRKDSFGALVRREREAKEIGLREMAKMIGVSPTYLSKVERDEFSQPAEEQSEGDCEDHARRRRAAALAGRVSTDISRSSSATRWN